MVEPLHVLAAALGVLATACSLLGGVWIGFRVTTRDAAVLARFASDAREARLLADLSGAQLKALREEWEAFAEQIERKRRATAASATKAARAVEMAEVEASSSEPPRPMSQRDRRRLVAARLNGRA